MLITRLKIRIPDKTNVQTQKILPYYFYSQILPLHLSIGQFTAKLKLMTQRGFC